MKVLNHMMRLEEKPLIEKPLIEKTLYTSIQLWQPKDVVCSLFINMVGQTT